MLFNFHNVMDSFEDIKIAVAGTGYEIGRAHV